MIVISYVLSWYLRFRSGIFEMDPWYLSLQVYMSVLIFIIPGYLLLYYIFQLYTPKRVRGRRLEAWNILQANTIGFLVFILVLYFRHQTDFSRTMIFVFYCINIFLEIVERNVIRMGLRKISTLTESWQIRTGDIISGVSLPIMFLEEQNIRRSGYWEELIIWKLCCRKINWMKS